MWRPLSQRIRESPPVRLMLDNRLVRHFADKPVTKAPTRRRTILVGLIPALTIVVLLVTGCFLVALYPGTWGSPLILLTLPILLFGGLFTGRSLSTTIVTILGAGLYFVAITSGSVRVVGDLILDTRGEEVTAVVVGRVHNPTGCAADTIFRSRLTGDRVSTQVTRLDGTPLPGAIGFYDQTHRDRGAYQQGEHVQVLVDPKNAVCMRAKSDVHLVVNIVIIVLAMALVAWVFIVAARNWRVWQREKYEKWRATAL